jgi:tRNA (guanine9-N1)-methyltransferase
MSLAPAEGPAEGNGTPVASAPASESTGVDSQAAKEEPPMSKNALKRLRKKQEWEDGKDDRRKRRKEKRAEQKVRKRDERDALISQGIDPASLQPKKLPSVIVPLSIILDCDFEKYMSEKELISLSSQVTRSYSDNRVARYKAYLWVAGWQGKLKERFETVLADTHKNWKGIGFVEGDFVECAAQARDKMAAQGGQMIEPLQKSLDSEIVWAKDEKDPFPLPDPEPEVREEHKNIVYLSSDSPYTLERLEPNTSYVIGGLVDKNREKGLCYRRARERGIRTAKLPIGQYMLMQSRQVLATNHVVEIMLKWLETEDWGQAFTSVIPKRKGGRLRGEEADGESEEDKGEDAPEEEVAAQVESHNEAESKS